MKSSLLIHSARPAWARMMQILHHGQHPGKASVMFLPMIDLDPGDTSCIYSTLHFVKAEAKRYDVNPVMTFDQPLYWKAVMINRFQPDDSDLKCMVLGLGGFHMQMSFLDSIRHLMADSGLHKLLEIAYASNILLATC